MSKYKIEVKVDTFYLIKSLLIIKDFMESTETIPYTLISILNLIEKKLKEEKIWDIEYIKKNDVITKNKEYIYTISLPSIYNSPKEFYSSYEEALEASR